MYLWIELEWISLKLFWEFFLVLTSLFQSSEFYIWRAKNRIWYVHLGPRLDFSHFTLGVLLDKRRCPVIVWVIWILAVVHPPLLYPNYPSEWFLRKDLQRRGKSVVLNVPSDHLSSTFSNKLDQQLQGSQLILHGSACPPQTGGPKPGYCSSQQGVSQARWLLFLHCWLTACSLNPPKFPINK